MLDEKAGQNEIFSLAPRADLSGLKEWQKTATREAKEGFNFTLVEQKSYRSATTRNVMTFATNVFRQLDPDEDTESVAYVPSPVRRRLVVYRQRPWFFGIFGTQVWKAKKFTVTIGRHTRTGEMATALKADPDLFGEIFEYTKSTHLVVDLEPYTGSFRDLLLCKHPRRDLSTGMLFSYLGLIFSVFFFLLDMARDIGHWDAAVTSLLGSK